MYFWHLLQTSNPLLLLIKGIPIPLPPTISGYLAIYFSPFFISFYCHASFFFWKVGFYILNIQTFK